MKLSLNLVGAGPNAAGPSARRQQGEQFVSGVIGVSDDPIGLPPYSTGCRGPPSTAALSCTEQFSPPSAEPYGWGQCYSHSSRSRMLSTVHLEMLFPVPHCFYIWTQQCLPICVKLNYVCASWSSLWNHLVHIQNVKKARNVRKYWANSCQLAVNTHCG